MIIYDESGYPVGEGIESTKGAKMTVSDERVKAVLLECLSKCMFPGEVVELIAAVKKEVSEAVVVPNTKD